MCNPETAALVCNNTPPALRALLLEAACQFVEHKYGVTTSRETAKMKAGARTWSGPDVVPAPPPCPLTVCVHACLQLYNHPAHPLSVACCCTPTLPTH